MGRAIIDDGGTKRTAQPVVRRTNPAYPRPDQYARDPYQNGSLTKQLSELQQRYRQDWTVPQQTAATPPAAPSGGGGRSYGGGGGGSYVDPQIQQAANYNAYAARVAQMLQEMQPGADTLSPRINQAVDADLAAARGAYGNVGNRTSDPYAMLEFIGQRFDPGVSQMVGSQGGDVNAASAAQQAGQSDQDYMAQLFNNYARSMSAVQRSSNDAWNADKGRDLAATESDLTAQRSALLAAAEQRQRDREEQYKQQRMQAMLQLLSTGLGMGVDVSGVGGI